MDEGTVQTKPKRAGILLAVALALSVTSLSISLMFSHFASTNLLLVSSIQAFIVIIIVIHLLWMRPVADEEKPEETVETSGTPLDGSGGPVSGIKELPEIEIEEPEEIPETETVGG